MADNENPYTNALENLQEYEGDLRQAFMRVAAENEQISIDYIAEILNSVSSSFPFDCENALNFFTWDNREIPDHYDLGALDFVQFFELFELWLRKEAESYDPVTARSRGNVPTFQGEIDLSAIQASKERPTSRSTPGDENSQALLKRLLQQNQKEYHNLFNDHVQKSGETELTVEGCFEFLQECFRASGIELKEKVKGLKDAYKTIEDYQQLLDTAEQYFIEEKKVDAGEFDVKEVTLAFKECFALLTYWMGTNEDIVLIDNRRRGRGVGITAALEETIEKYEKMIQEAENETERHVLESTVETLKAQLNELQKGKSRSKSVKDGLDPLKREERRVKALKEIFEVYCLQQLKMGKHGTFDKYNRLSNTITLGTFKTILKDFRLKINHLKLVELYNKSTMSDENMTLDEFMDFLSKVALRAEVVTEIKVHQPNPEVRKEYRPDCYKRDNTYKTFKEEEEKKKQIFTIINKKKKAALFKDQVKRDADTLEEIWEHMGLYDNGYKTWIGLVRLPFSSKEKERIAPDSLTYKFKTKGTDGKDPREVVEEIQRRNELRKLVKDLKTVEKSFISNFKAPSATNSRVDISISRQSREESNSYASQQKNRTQKSLPNIKKLTMKGVENFQEDDIMKIDDKFNPHELIEENDEEDDMYLQEYNIRDRERRVQPQSQDLSKKKYENYGRLKKVSEGFAVKYGNSSKQQESRTNLEREDSYRGNYSHGNYYDSRNYTNSKGTPLNQNNITVGPNSVKQTKGANSIYKSLTPNYQSNPNFKPTRPQLYGNNEGNITYNADYSRNAQNPDYNSGNAPYVSTNGYVLPKTTGYTTTLNRIERIEKDAYQREQQMMGNVLNIQNQQMQKGLKTVRK